MKKRFILSIGFLVAFIFLTASLVYAQGITIGRGAILNINDGTFNVPYNIVINGEMRAITGTINVGGNWTNNGTFTAGTGTVNFIDGQSPVGISGTSLFYNLKAVTTAGKQLNFEAAKEQRVTNLLKLQGDCASGKLLALRSTIPGQLAQIKLENAGTQDIYAVDVMDHQATGQWLAPYFPDDICSIDQGNNIKWFLYTYLLNVSKNGDGNGTVTSDPPGIDCGADCWETYTSGTVVTLTATPDGTFTGWGGACSGTALQCIVTMDAAKSVTATFTRNAYTLTVSKNGTGNGTVTSSPPGIDCGADCSETYTSGTVVTLTPTPDADSIFTGWSGDADCTDGVVTMNADKTCTAKFDRNTYTLSVNKNGTGNGTVTSSPVGIDCGADCWETYPSGTVVTLTATPDGTSTFTGWGGACSGTAPQCEVTIDAAKSVTAIFEALIPGVVELPKTGQIDCYDTNGDWIPCNGTGQDGEIQAGITWPDPRFTDNMDGTITDNLTGLMWPEDANLMATKDPGFDTDGTSGDGIVRWQGALNYVAQLNTEAYRGYTDWRLPNVIEMEGLISFGRSNLSLPVDHLFTNLSTTDAKTYWTSTTAEYSPGSAFLVNIDTGSYDAWPKSSYFKVWPVRTSGSASVIEIPQTGQKDCYNTTGATISCAGTGQDGDTRAGVPWPDPRFSDNGNGTIRDRLTGLTWAMDANLPGADTTWQEALDYVEAMNAGTYPNFGYTDWRLPNVKELQSLVDYGNYNPALVLNHPFIDLPNGGHWTSTSWIPPEDAGVSWAIGITNGSMSGGVKSGGGFHVWPVRGGKRSEYRSPGLNPPIKPDKRYTLGSTIPVKFQLQDQNGDYVCTVGARIYIAPIIDGVVGQEIEGVSTGGANEGNIFRCDENKKQYIFNLSTKNLTEGEWQIRVELDDGTEFTGRIILDKRVQVDFQSMTQSGETTFTVSNSGPPPPSGHNFGAEPTYFDISTTTIFSGLVEVCIAYDETQFRTERSLKLFHWNGSSWENITTSLDTTANIICGLTTSFSPFIVAEELSTAVTLQSFSARLDGNQVIISWSTSFEIDNEGFVILRSESPGGPFTQITKGIIPAVGGSGKVTYTFTDSNVEHGKTYYYRLQDIDNRGRVTAHQIISVSVDVAEMDKISWETTGQKNNVVTDSQQPEIRGTVKENIPQPGMSDTRPVTWVSIVTPGHENEPAMIKKDSAMLSGEDPGDTDRVYTSSASIHKDDENTSPSPIPTLSLPLERGGKKGGGEGWVSSTVRQPPAETTLEDDIVETLHTPYGPSSFSVSIEDDKGNIIVINKIEDTAGTATQTSGLGLTKESGQDSQAGGQAGRPEGLPLQVKEESGRTVLTWEGRGGVKGFILHRSEKGKDNYTAITNLIPYFGKNDKDVFLYRFTDNTTKPGVKYAYRLERVEVDDNAGLKIGKMAD